MGKRARLLLPIGVWIVAVVAATMLGLARFRAALPEPQPDLESFFLPAARTIVAGGDPYDVDGYFYPPFVALLLAPVADTPYAAAYWTALRVVAGIGACVLAALAAAPRRAWTQAGVIAVIALVTLLWSVPATLDLWAGQVEMLVLLALCGAALAETRGWRVVAGFSLGTAALIKTWPALFVTWLVRRGARRRGPQWLGVAAAAAVAVGTALIVAGPEAVVGMVVAPLAGGDQPLLAANSVWGLPRVLFTETPMASPLIASPVLHAATTVVLVLWIAGLGVVVLRHPGDDFISLFNLAFVVVLLLPVSHYFYVIYALPTLWWWVARVLTGDRSVPTWVALGTCAAWWVLVFRVPPAGDGFMTTTWPSQLLIFGASAVAATASVWAAARASHVDQRSQQSLLLQTGG